MSLVDTTSWRARRAPMQRLLFHAFSSSILAFAGHAAAQAGGPGKTIFNVIEFGATGNGGTDDRAAIQAALTAAEDAVQRSAGAASPSGAVVFFPEGIYRVTSTLS